MEKQEVKKRQSLFLIVNIVLATFAFAFLVGMATPGVAGEISDVEGGTVRDRAPSPSRTNTETSAGNAPGITANLPGDIGAGKDKILTKNPDWTVNVVDAAADPKKVNFFKSLIKPTTGGKGLLQAVGWAGTAYGITKFLGPKIGLSPELSSALSKGIGAGLFAGQTAYALFSPEAIEASSGQIGSMASKLTGSGNSVFQKGFSLIGGHPVAFGIGVGAVVFLLTYKKVEYERIDFSCNSWEAPIGGEDCEKCNDGINPCSEYRCKSLGQACGIVNEGTSEEKCVWQNPRDVTSPIIRPWEEALKTESASRIKCEYTNLGQRPDGKGTQIKCQGIENGCVPAFTPIEFGIQTNKPAQCKVDFILKDDYDSMQYYLGENSLYDYNHSQRLNIPNKRAVEALAQSLGDELNDTGSAITIQNDNQYTMYIRCSSANGYYNPDPYVIEFCVDDGPDATPPQIIETSIRNNQPVQFGVDEVPIFVYTNEPASCKWSRTDQQYNEMENAMTCASSIAQIDSNLLYPCQGTLTNLEDRKDNVYYFRCEDQPWAVEKDRIKMTQSYELTLKGTQELNIKEGSIKPEEGKLVSGATTTVPVMLELETEDGFDKGKSECSYSINENSGFVPMLNTNSYKHSQRQDLTAGKYTYYLRCVDDGGNTASSKTSFEVFVDSFAPQVVRIVNKGVRLKINTDEEAECYYATNTNTGCNYDINENSVAQKMSYGNLDNKQEHFATWDTSQTYYIKCKDKNNKQPSPNQCSIIVKPVELSEEE